MPAGYLPPDTTSVLDDIQQRLRRLESGMARSLALVPVTVATPVAMSLLASAAPTPAFNQPFRGTWTALNNGCPFTVPAGGATILAFMTTSWVGNGGTANYINLTSAILLSDGVTIVTSGGQGSATNGAGYANCTLPIATVLAAGNYIACLLYSMNAGAVTTVSENHGAWSPQYDVYMLGHATSTPVTSS